MHTHTRACVRARVRARVRACVRAYLPAYICIFLYIYAYNSVRTSPKAPFPLCDRANYRFEEWEGVVDAGRRARAQAIKLHHARIQCKGSYLIGYGIMMLGRLDEAEEWFHVCDSECLRGKFENSRAYLLLARGDLTLLRLRQGALRETGGLQVGSQGLAQQAEGLLREGLALSRRVEDAPAEALALLRIAACHVSCARGDGWEMLAESLRIAEELDDVIAQSNVLEFMGGVWMRRQEPSKARKAWERCLALRQRVAFAAGAARVRRLLCH